MLIHSRLLYLNLLAISTFIETPDWVTYPTFWRVSVSINRKLCLFLGSERKFFFFVVIVMLSVQVTVAATFPETHLCCVVDLVDIRSHPSNTTVALPYFLCR